MKRNLSRSGFTLVEMLTVMLIIAILAALVLNIHGFVNAKASKARADGEIQAISAACETYKTDNGSYPRAAGITEGNVTGTVPTLAQSKPPIDPRVNGSPISTNYKNASQYLYSQLSGDLNHNGTRDKTSTGDLEPAGYITFRGDQLGRKSGSSSSSSNSSGDNDITFLQDPYGNSYGYSTAGATDEDCFQSNLRSGGTSVSRPATPHGFNSTFDLWSTGGRTNDPGSGSSGSDANLTWGRWVKNW